MSTLTGTHNHDLEKNARYPANSAGAGYNDGYGGGAGGYGNGGRRRIANPAPLGLFSFASTVLVLSLISVHTKHVTSPNIVMAMSLAVGGLAQLLAGMWEFACGNTFGATMFTSYGGFFISYGIIYWPGSGILAAYSASQAGSGGSLFDAFGIYLIPWFIFTTLMFFATHRATGALAALYFFWMLSLMLLMIASFRQSSSINKAGGAFGLVTAAIAYYAAAAAIITRDTGYFGLPTGNLPKNRNAGDPTQRT